MPTFESDGVTINYIDEGNGPAIVLVHGFASSLHGNWRTTGIIDALAQNGRRVVALDCRGHGRSDKPHDPEAYGGTKMAGDVIRLMNHLGIEKADLMGYSMGAGISASLLVDHPERFRTIILGGAGDRMLLGGGRPPAGSEAIARALEAEDGGRSEDATARGFRVFAERSGNDLHALAAIQRSSRGGLDASKLSETKLPVLILLGEKDDLVGGAGKLAATIPSARYIRVPGDHITAFDDPKYKNEVINFLAEESPTPA